MFSAVQTISFDAFFENFILSSEFKNKAWTINLNLIIRHTSRLLDLSETNQSLTGLMNHEIKLAQHWHVVYKTQNKIKKINFNLRDVKSAFLCYTSAQVYTHILLFLSITNLPRNPLKLVLAHVCRAMEFLSISL